MDPELHLRVARQDDVESMVAIYRDGLSDHIAVGPSPTTLRLELRTSIGTVTSECIVVAEYAGAIIAWARVLPLTEARPTIRAGEIRAHVARGQRDGGFDDALFWEAETVAEERLYLSLACYAPLTATPTRCVCERFQYHETSIGSSRDVFAHDTGPLVVFEKRLTGKAALSVAR